MAIPFKIVPRKKPGTNEFKYYPQVQTASTANRDDFMELIEKRSTVASADIKAVLDSLEFEIKQQLLNGISVRLGDLGSFHVTSSGEGKVKREESTARDIKRIRVQFIPSRKFMNYLQPTWNGGHASFTSAKEDTE